MGGKRPLFWVEEPHLIRSSSYTNIYLQQKSWLLLTSLGLFWHLIQLDLGLGERDCDNDRKFQWKSLASTFCSLFNSYFLNVDNMQSNMEAVRHPSQELTVDTITITYSP